jgi:hypothetical protein
MGLLVLCLSFQVAQAQIQTTISIHVHNPEGVEIGSIEKVSYQEVMIYDKLDTEESWHFLGYGTNDAESHPRVFTIAQYPQTIKVNFNGMELTKHINGKGGDVLTFVFSRTELFKENLLNKTSSGSQEFWRHVLHYWPGGYSWAILYYGESGYWRDYWSGTVKEPKNQSGIVQERSGFEVHVDINYHCSDNNNWQLLTINCFYDYSVTPSAVTASGYFTHNASQSPTEGNKIQLYLDVSDVSNPYIYYPIDNIPPQSFTFWYIQNIYQDLMIPGTGYASVELMSSINPYYIIQKKEEYSSHNPKGYGVGKLSANINYDKIRIYLKYIMGSGKFYTDGIYNIIESENFKMVSVPYDLLGTGIYDTNKPPINDWTIMVYCAGDINLSGGISDDITEMENGLKNAGIPIGSASDSVNIIVLSDPIGFQNSAVYEILSGDSINISSQFPVVYSGEVNTGDPVVLRDFVGQTVANYPAEHYALILWGHGWGWRVSLPKSSPIKENYQINNVCPDQDGNALENVELKQALNYIHNYILNKKIDFIGFDACLMQMLEVEYLAKIYAEIMVGSEDIEPLTGWMYEFPIHLIVQNSKMSAADLGIHFVDFYGGRTLSTVNLNIIDNVSEKLDTLCCGLLKNMDYQKIRLAREKTQTYDYPEVRGQIDLYHFAENIKIQYQGTTIEQAANELMNTITFGDGRAVLFSKSIPDLPNTHGIAIWFPCDSMDFSDYRIQNAEFCMNNHWDDLLEAYFNATSVNTTVSVASGNTTSIPISNTKVTLDFESGPGGNVTVTEIMGFPSSSQSNFGNNKLINSSGNILASQRYWVISTTMQDGSFTCILKIEYDTNDFPEGLTEDNVNILYYDEESSQYVMIPTSRDTLNDILWTTGYLDHFSRFFLGRVEQPTVLFEFPQSGWYMVSLPVIPPDSSVKSLFPTALGEVAFEWNPVIDSYEAVTKMEPKKGYWLAIPGTTIDQVSGIPLDDYMAHFSLQGWYMIGSIKGSVDFAVPNDYPDEKVLSPAFGWDVVSGSYVSATTLDEKKGYWVAVLGACDLAFGGVKKGMSGLSTKSNWEAFTKQYNSQPPLPPNIDWNTGKIVQTVQKYSLSQNYPNPFNPETTIGYQISQTGNVRLIIYNTMGRVVKKLVDKQQNAGYYEAVWDGKDENGLSLNSGMYLVRMEAEGFVEMRKVVLIK